MIFKDIIMVGLGGFVGSSLRYALSVFMAPIVLATAFPWATLSVNLIGSFAIGLIMALGTSGSLHFFCVMGICGGFTTFSTLSLELFEMVRLGAYSTAAIYILLSVGLGLAAVGAGLLLGTKL